MRDDPLDADLDQIVLGTEMIVDQPNGNIRFLRDIPYGDVLDQSFRLLDQRDRCVDDLFLNIRLVWHLIILSDLKIEQCSKLF